MNIELSKRGILTIFFRHFFKFFAIFLLISTVGGLYAYTAVPMYAANASLLIKFGADAAALDITKDGQNGAATSQQDQQMELSSDVELMQSRELLRQVVTEFGVEAIYPGLTEKSQGHDSPLEMAVTRLLKKDYFVKNGQQSNIVNLTVMNQNPVIAEKVLQRILDLIIEKHAEIYKTQPTEFLAEQVKEAAAKLAASQAKLESFKQRNALSSLDDELQQLMREKSDVQTSAMKGIDDAQAKLNDLRLKERDLLNTYRPDSPVIVDLQQNIALAEQQLAALQDDFRSAGPTRSHTDSDNVVAGHVGGINRRIAEIEAKRGTYDDLVRQTQLDEDNYKTYTQRNEQARISASLNKNKLSSMSIIDRPVIPLVPDHPNKLMILIASILAGFVLAAWTILMLERFDDRFTNPDQVSRELGVPVLASFSNSSQS